MKNCDDARKAFPNIADVECCDSCHEEWEKGYERLCENEINGVTYEVCCEVSSALDEEVD